MRSSGVWHLGSSFECWRIRSPASLYGFFECMGLSVVRIDWQADFFKTFIIIFSTQKDQFLQSVIVLSYSNVLVIDYSTVSVYVANKVGVEASSLSSVFENILVPMLFPQLRFFLLLSQYLFLYRCLFRSFLFNFIKVFESCFDEAFLIVQNFSKLHYFNFHEISIKIL